MKYTVAIIVCTAFFAVLGVLAAWGAADYYTSGGESSRGDRDTAAMIFALLPLGGTVVGAAVGCLAVYFGRRYADPADPVQK